MEFPILSSTDALTNQFNMEDKEEDKAEDLSKIEMNYTH